MCVEHSTISHKTLKVFFTNFISRNVQVKNQMCTSCTKQILLTSRINDRKVLRLTLSRNLRVAAHNTKVLRILHNFILLGATKSLQVLCKQVCCLLHFSWGNGTCGELWLIISLGNKDRKERRMTRTPTNLTYVVSTEQFEKIAQKCNKNLWWFI